MQKFIVAEITKSWNNQTSEDSLLVSQKFEDVINVNLERGYKLSDWKCMMITTGGSVLTETIIAIFERID